MVSICKIYRKKKNWKIQIQKTLLNIFKIPIPYHDFFAKVSEKTNEDYWYFAEQYFYTPNQPKLEYYQTNDDFYYRWNDVNDNFIMPIDLLIGFSSFLSHILDLIERSFQWYKNH